MNENFAVFCLIAGLLVISSLVTGFTCGFGGFVLYVAGVALVTWLYHRFVVCRPRYEPARAFVGSYLGHDFYI